MRRSLRRFPSSGTVPAFCVEFWTLAVPCYRVRACLLPAWLFWLEHHLMWQVAPLISTLSVVRCPIVAMVGSGVVWWLGWVLVVFLLSAVLFSLLCLVAPLPSMLSIHWCPTVEYTVRLVVGTARFPGMGLLRCCGPYVGSCRLRFCVLLSGCGVVRVQSYAKSAGNVSRDGAVALFE